MHTLTSSNRVVWFCTSAPVSFTSFSSQPRPRVLHIIPFMLVPMSLEHLAQTPSLELISLSTPRKRLLCPNSTHTQSDVDQNRVNILFSDCPLPLTLGAVPQETPGPLFHPLQRLLQTSSPHPALSVHDLPICPSLAFIAFLSFPGKSLLPPPSQEPCPINNSLSSLNVLSFLEDFFPLDTESSGFSSISLVHSLRTGSP